MLEFFCSLLNSRPIYYLIIKKYGELEWRSHPYLTINQIRELPLPFIISSIRQILIKYQPLLQLLRKELQFNGGISDDLDIAIERMVAELFSLDRSDYEKIYDTLNSIEQLLPVRNLLSIEITDIF